MMEFGIVLAQAEQGSGGMSSLFLMVGFIIVFFLIMSYPQSKAAKRRKAMLSAIKAGDRVETVSRVIGTVYEVRGQFVIVDISNTPNDRMRVKMSLEGIATVLTENGAEDKKSEDKKSEDNEN